MTFGVEVSSAHDSLDQRHARAARDAMLEGLGSANYELIDLDGRCDIGDVSCLNEAAKAEGYQYIIGSTIDFDEPDFQIELSIRTLDGEVVVRSEFSCEICGESELLQRLRDESATLVPRIERLQALPATLLVSGTPTGASVLIDGALVGALPFEGELPAGPHTLEVSSKGHISASRELDLSSGVEESVHLQLGHRPVEKERREFTSKPALGWGLVGGGAVGLAAGVTLLIVDGRPHGPTCPPETVDINGQCPNTYTTKAGGVAALSLGVLVAAGGATLLVLSSPKSRVSAALTPSGVQLWGRF